MIRIIRYIIENPKISLRKVALKFSFHPNIISDITKSFLSEEEYYNRYLISTSQSRINQPLLIFLDSRKADILSGQFIPNIPNLSVINPLFNKNSTRLIVNKWLKKNTSFINLSDLIKYFKPTPTQLGYSLVQQKGFIIKYSKIFIRNFNFNLPNNFIDVVLTVYKDILNFIDPDNTNNAFDIFYESMTMKTRTKNTVVKVGIRSEKSLAGVLVYYSLLFYFYNKKSLTQKEEDILINEIILEHLETLFNLSKHALRKKSPIIHHYLAKIPKYKFIFKKKQISSLKRIRKNITTYQHFNYNHNILKYLKNNDLRDILTYSLSNIKNNNFPSYIFDLGFRKASDFKFQGSNEERFKTKIITDYFIDDRDLVREMTNSDNLYIICKTVQGIYNSYGLKSLGKNGHNIIENYFVNNFNLGYNIFPFVKELPVWKFNLANSITGHIDIGAFYYLNNQLYFLILDFKPKGASEILKSIPQLTIYGFLFQELLFNSAQSLGINLSKKDFKIFCIGFSNTKAYAFNPFLVYDHIQCFLDYETALSNRINPISLDKKALAKLVTFINLL